MKKIIIIFSLFLLVTNCSKYRFNTITETDDIGNHVGDVDEKDWRTDDKWLLSEKNLFDSNYDLNCKINHNFKITGFPNPCWDLAKIYFEKDSLTSVEGVLTNSSLKILVEFELGRNSSNFSFSMEDRSPGYYRVYYKLIKGGCEFRGHGDILNME